MRAGDHQENEKTGEWIGGSNGRVFWEVIVFWDGGQRDGI